MGKRKIQRRSRPCLFEILVIVLAVGFLGCKHKQDRSQLQKFFENARRRDGQISERQGIGFFGHCTGFFVKSRFGKNLFATARHCVNYDPEAWCQGDGSSTGITDAVTSTRYLCKRIALADEFHDPFLIEFSGERSGLAFDLSDSDPPVGTMLKMLGYPRDPGGKKGTVLMVTENCQVLKVNQPNPFRDLATPSNPGATDRQFTHNCSVYGGNSGGPIIIEGTSVVVGMPSNYFPGNFSNFPSTGEGAYAASIADFVSGHGDQAHALGLSMISGVEGSGRGKYLRTGEYSSDSYGCTIAIESFYETSTEIRHVILTERCLKADEADPVKLMCHNGVCSGDFGDLVPNDSGGFVLKRPGIHSCVFRPI